MDFQSPKMPIHQWAEADRPREKLVAKGKESLSEAELLAIIIGSGNHKESAVDLCRRILAGQNNSLDNLGKLTVKELTKYNGIGEAKAISIVAAIEIGSRRRLEVAMQKKQIQSSKDAAELFISTIGGLQHEEFWVLLLNRANHIIGKHKIGVGGLVGTVADTRILYKIALENLAIGIILCHNHPSGSLKPSKQDITLTDKIKEAGKALEIKVLDHIIVNSQSYFSFADEGLL